MNAGLMDHLRALPIKPSRFSYARRDRTLSEAEGFFPGASTAWETVGEFGPTIFRFQGITLVAEDPECWTDRHRDTCRCYVWRPFEQEWERWIKR